MIVVWPASARRDLLAVRQYIAEHNRQAAARVAELIIDRTSQLAEFPRRGRPGRKPGTRELVITGTPYLVVYRAKGDQVRILRVIHGARDWPPRDLS